MKRIVLVTAFAVLSAIAAYAQWPTGPKPPAQANRVLVLKGKHEMQLLRHDQVLKKYRVSLGRNSIGPKTQAGDHRTPEGFYVLDWRNPHSKFHRSIHISYPDPRDVANARRTGVQPGGDIMIHGLQNGLGWLGRLHRWVDWTDGCIAVTNAEMDQIWQTVPDRTPIEIRP